MLETRRHRGRQSDIPLGPGPAVRRASAAGVPAPESPAAREARRPRTSRRAPGLAPTPRGLPRNGDRDSRYLSGAAGLRYGGLRGPFSAAVKRGRAATPTPASASGRASPSRGRQPGRAGQAAESREPRCQGRPRAAGG